MWRDLVFSARLWRRSPAPVLACVVTLAVGIGSATTVFSAMETVRVGAMPYGDPAGLVQLFQAYTPRATMDRMSVAAANAADWRAAQSLDGLFPYRHRSVNLSGAGDAIRVRAVEASPEMFGVLRVQAAIGRVFDASDAGPEQDRPVVLSHAFWTRHLEARPSIVGDVLSLNGERHVVVGVMPAGFRFPVGWLSADVEAWRPLTLTPQAARDRATTGFEVVGRLRAGVPVEQASAELRRIAARLAVEHPATNRDWSVTVLPLRERFASGLGRMLWFLALAAAGLLLISSANAGGLLLVRGLDRQPELAVRTMLGAGRGTLLRQAVAEGIALSLLGGVLGVLLAASAASAAAALPPVLALRELQEMRLDVRALAFALVVALGSGLLFSLLPAVASRRSPRLALPDGTRTTESRERARLRSTLVVAELAMAAAMLACATAAAYSFGRALQVDPGYATDGAAAFRVQLPPERYPEPAQWADFFGRLETVVASTPGVVAAGAGSGAPMDGGGSVLRYRFEGRPAPEFVPGGPPVFTEYMRVGADYFEAAGIRLIEGRAFSVTDGLGPRVAVVNEAFVSRIPEGSRALGTRIVLGGDVNRTAGVVEESDPVEIVGVVASTRHYALYLQSPPIIYVPLRQDPERAMAIVFRTPGDPTTVLPALRKRLAAIDPLVPMYSVQTLTDLARTTHATLTVQTVVLTALGGVAWLLSLVGIYGLFAATVARRRHELGLRAALGASGGRLLRFVLGRATLVAAVGLTAGLVLAQPLLSQLRSAMAASTGLSLDVDRVLLSTAVAAGGLLAALLACAAPAWRASRANPADAWRHL